MGGTQSDVFYTIKLYRLENNKLLPCGGGMAGGAGVLFHYLYRIIAILLMKKKIPRKSNYK